MISSFALLVLLFVCLFVSFLTYLFVLFHGLFVCLFVCWLVGWLFGLLLPGMTCLKTEVVIIFNLELPPAISLIFFPFSSAVRPTQDSRLGYRLLPSKDEKDI